MMLDMTPMGWLGRKFSTQTNKHCLLSLTVFPNIIIIIMGFFINVQVQGLHPHQWAPFQVAGLLHTSDLTPDLQVSLSWGSIAESFRSLQSLSDWCGLITHQPLWVILRRLTEKGRREIEETVEGQGKKENEWKWRKRRNKNFPVYPYLLQG